MNKQKAEKMYLRYIGECDECRKLAKESENNKNEIYGAVGPSPVFIAPKISKDRSKKHEHTP